MDSGNKYKGITTCMRAVLGPVVTGTVQFRARGSSKLHGMRVDTDITRTTCEHGIQAKTVEGAAILDALERNRLTLLRTQVKYVCHKRKLVAITDGVAVHQKTGKQWLIEWKTGYVCRRSRQQRFELPGLGHVYDNAQNRALLQLSTAMVLSGIENGLLLFASKKGTVQMLKLPTKFPEMSNSVTAAAVLDALSFSS
jgi:hypothetical protein